MHLVLVLHILSFKMFIPFLKFSDNSPQLHQLNINGVNLDSALVVAHVVTHLSLLCFGEQMGADVFFKCAAVSLDNGF